MRRRYWIGLIAVVAAVVAAGTAVAATKLESPKAESKAILNDAAGRLHVTPDALSSALRKAQDDQVDAAVAAGRLTKQQGDALKARINAGQAPLGDRFGFGFHGPGFGFRARRGFGFRPGEGIFHPGFLGGMFGFGLNAVTSYLGITPAQLRNAVGSGKSLAQIAKAHGKTSDGLVAALVAAAKTGLDKAVTAKHLTASKEQSILSKLQRLFKSMVNRTLPAWSTSMLHDDFGSGSPHWSWKQPGEKHSQSPSSTAPWPRL
jgi:hypothetical protein